MVCCEQRAKEPESDTKNSNGTVSRRRRKSAETVCRVAPTCCRLLRENENRETRVWACRMVVAGGSFTGERGNLKLMLCAQGFSVQRNKAAEGTTFFHAGRDVGLQSAVANRSVWVFGWRMPAAATGIRGKGCTKAAASSRRPICPIGASR